MGTAAYWAVLIPTVYFHVALFMIERNAMTRDRVDWPTVRAEADQLIHDARSTRDTYAAIRLVLRRLGDNHSHFVPPEAVRAARRGSNLTLGLTAIWPECVVALVSPGGSADRAGIKVGDVLESVDGTPPANVERVVLLPGDRQRVTLVLRRPGLAAALRVELAPQEVQLNQPAAVRRLDGGLGYIDIPGVLGGGGSFDLDAVRRIRAADAPPTCGWWSTYGETSAGTCGQCCTRCDRSSAKPTPSPIVMGRPHGRTKPSTPCRGLIRRSLF
jgi:hypothetical protein